MKQAAQTILDQQQHIMDTWQETVERLITASRNANKLALYDHLPDMIRDIADILIRFHGSEDMPQDEKYQEIVANSSEHGRHRSTSEGYTVDQIMHEYIIFHRTLTNTLRAHNTYNTDVADLLKYIIETAMLQSVAAFNNSLQQMQEKLMGTLAHDLRNPLSTTYSLLDLISDKRTGDNFEMLRLMAVRSVQKALKLTEQLLDSVTLRAGEGMMLTFAETDIVKEVQAVHEEACQIYTQKIVLECPEGEIIGVIDGVAIRRLLENLLTNAIKYGDINQTITIKVEDSDEQVHLGVHNYGNPIPIERQQMIFNFLNHDSKKSDRERQSWGMGLTLIRVVTESHGGKVSLNSNAEQGTQFIITLSKENKPGKRRTRVFEKEPIPA
ncbi:sensor histidine kinase [Tunicatimonas pelagia]|uniref:sensor histidine kinase n=1 Tax=Tunicatimonas pelagia TaxID=931531 RepID=UPI0026661057|nr:HAMP domain-containing sensor histidine kinase [Tunicatimonas pelagia]WKN43288.1 HAMP domain-containing sensor histidine kinase [Tunicatimonas pelagia]